MSYSTLKYNFKVTKLNDVAVSDKSPFPWNGPGDLFGLIFPEPVLCVQ